MEVEEVFNQGKSKQALNKQTNKQTKSTFANIFSWWFSLFSSFTIFTFLLLAALITLERRTSYQSSAFPKGRRGNSLLTSSSTFSPCSCHYLFLAIIHWRLVEQKNRLRCYHLYHSCRGVYSCSQPTSYHTTIAEAIVRPRWDLRRSSQVEWINSLGGTWMNGQTR